MPVATRRRRRPTLRFFARCITELATCIQYSIDQHTCNYSNCAHSACAPTNAAVALNTQLTWPAGTVNPAAATNYHWTIDNPGNTRRAQRAGPTAVNTASGWSGTLATAARAVDLSQAGTYAVSVHADVPGLPADCDPADATSFAIPVCQCPAPVANASQEWAVTGVAAPLGPNRLQTVLCDHANIPLTLAVNPGGYQPGWSQPRATPITGPARLS